MGKLVRSFAAIVTAVLVLGTGLALAPTASAGTVGTETTAAVPVNLSHDVTAFRGSSANSNLVGWEDWLGQDTDLALDFFPGGRYTSGFTSMLNSAPAMINAWKASGRTVVWSTPILFTGQTLAQGASGTFDHYFVDLANKLVAGGAEDAVMRLGWEFNGAWFPWTIVSKPGGPTAATLAANYAAYYRRIVNAMRSVSGSAFRFDWNPNMGGAVQPDAAYPGDAYVDYVGLDVYDQSFAAAHANATTRWNFFLTRPTGLNWLRDFAATHGKQISLPEWALTKNHVAGSMSDNPLFIQNMHDWINAHNVAYASYFEFDGTNPMIHRLMLGHFPQGTAKFKTIFGDTGGPIGDTTPPGVPTGLTASGTTAGNSLNWNDVGATDLAGYHVERSVSGGSYVRLTTGALSDSAYVDASASTGVSSTYRVLAVDTSGNASAVSTTASATRPVGSVPAATARINAGGIAQTVGGTTWTGCEYVDECASMVSGGFPRVEDAGVVVTGVPSPANATTYNSTWTSAVPVTFSVPVTNGTYQVKLHFSETIRLSAGKRLFDVNVEGGTAELVNFDIFAAAGGKDKAVVRTVTATVTDGVMNLVLTPRLDKARVNAIEIIPA